jgi:MOSC domain-containing protein YiiM
MNAATVRAVLTGRVKPLGSRFASGIDKQQRLGPVRVDIEGLELLERPCPEWPLDRLLRLLYRSDSSDADLAPALRLPLVPSWRRLLERRLETGSIEDWRQRLSGA